MPKKCYMYKQSQTIIQKFIEVEIAATINSVYYNYIV
jgi:hypothetical protein